MIYQEKDNSEMVLIVAVFCIVAVFIGFSAGYFVRDYQVPEMTKKREKELVSRAVESIAAVANARVIQLVTCGSCHD